MTTLTDFSLTDDILAHLDVQLASARRMLQIVLEQASAIRRRAVRQVVVTAGELQVEMHRRELIERERAALMQRAAAELGIPAAQASARIGFSSVAELMDLESAQIATSRNAELRQLLGEIEREHELNRALMTQELAFLDHLLGLAGAAGGYVAPAGTRASRSAISASRVHRQRLFDLEA